MKKQMNFFVKVLIMLAITYVVFGFILQVSYIPTESMEPTIMTNDYCIFNRLAYKMKTPERGDVIQFKSDELGENLCKRVIGVGGDVITFVDGYVYVNGKLYDESAYIPIDIETNCTKSFEVPAGSYFVLGDNRESSFDSRFWENPYVKESDIESKMMVVIPLHCKAILDIIYIGLYV